jgi:predicted phage baseplate assembly protein
VAVAEDASPLRAGDAILIEDATQPERNEIVTLIENAVVQPGDASTGVPRLTILRWAAGETLRYEHCLDAGRTVVRGNLVHATHGATLETDGGTPLGFGDESLKRLRFTLSRAPLTFVSPPGATPEEATSTLRVTVDDEPWTERASLVDSGPFDQHYRVELDDEGYATIVFGDGIRGQKPPTGAEVAASYRIGIGPAGNVGRDTLVELVSRDDKIVSVTNPLPATGGVAPESKDEARRVAPIRVQTPIRAVTESDYERAAREYVEGGAARIERARARFLWTGSWHTVFISVDPIGGQALSPELRTRLYTYLKGRKLAGYDLEIVPATYVPLLIGLRVCVTRDVLASDVRARLLDALSNRVNADGTTGFFHPDRFTFGDPVLLSRLYAAVEDVPGVDSVVVTDFRRLHQRDPLSTTANLARGLISVGEFDIARLDNDPSFPENGRLRIDVLGGR